MILKAIDKSTSFESPTPDSLFRLESDTSREGVVVLYYKSKEMNGLL